MSRAILIFVLVGSIAALRAQGPPPTVPTPTFEVASVRPNMSGERAQSGRIGTGSVALTNMRLRAVIASAFGIRPDRIEGAPSWMEQERFDINARAVENTPDDRLRLMLQALLAERFRLTVRYEQREQPVFALVVARADGTLGPTLTPSTTCVTDAAGGSATLPRAPAGARPCGVVLTGMGGDVVLTAGARPISVLVDWLQGPGLPVVIDRPVVDRTGLTGTYDFDLRFAGTDLTAASADTGGNSPSVFTAVQEQLGLKLEPSRGSVEVLVIDSLERPTPD